MTSTLYGITNCDTVKKARHWLEQRDLAYTFHDYKKMGISRAQIERWCDALGWEKVLNRAGTTFRKLPDNDKANLDRRKAIDLMLAQPSMIKRPIVEHGDKVTAGFAPEAWQALPL